MLRFRNLILAILCLCLLSGCSSIVKTQGNKSGEFMLGDSLYVYEGYLDKLAEMGLEEVIALPYFQSVFVDIAKDADGQEYAVLFRKSGQVGKKALPVSFEEITKILEQKGVKQEVISYFLEHKQEPKNLCMLEINGELFWFYGDGKLDFYLDLSGKETYPF